MRFVEKYGDPKDVLERQELKDYMQVDEEARRFYEAFEYDLNGVQTRLSQKLIDEYTQNASVLKMLQERMNELQATTHALGGGRRNDLEDNRGSWQKAHCSEKKQGSCAERLADLRAIQ